MKRFLVPLVLLTLAACSQAPTSETEALPELAPMFGTYGGEVATGLAKHGTGVYAVGYTSGNLHGTNKGANDAFIRKYSKYSTLLWGRQFGTTSSEDAAGVATDAYHNAYVVGSTQGVMATGALGGYDLFLRKYTSSGGIAWTRQFGSLGYDRAGAVAVHGSSVYVVGYVDRSLGDASNYDGILRKYTLSGSLVWHRQIDASILDIAKDVAVDESGNIYVVGTTQGPLARPDVDGSDMFIQKYSPSGNVLWTRQLNYGAQDSGSAVATRGSSVILAGLNSYGYISVVKYTSGGSQVWDRGFGSWSQNSVHDLSTDSDGNVYFAGDTLGNFGDTNKGGYDGYIYKLNSSGNTLWGKHIGTPETDRTYAVLARTTDEVYAAGLTFGLLSDTYQGNGDAYLRRLNPSGSTVWTR